MTAFAADVVEGLLESPKCVIYVADHFDVAPACLELYHSAAQLTTKALGELS